MNFKRVKCGRGFSYIGDDGRRLSTSCAEHKKIKAWIQRLAIPPAWVNVVINSDPGAKIVAHGRDESAKKQYLYSDDWKEGQSLLKYQRTQRFACKLGVMRKATRRHLSQFDSGDDTKPSRNQVLAIMVRLIDSAYFRPGNERYSEENRSYGITTLRSKHLTSNDGELEFNYRGKSGVAQHKIITSPKLVRIVQELDEQPGYRIFKYFEGGQKVYVNSEDLNGYISDIMGNEYSAKDFRTWAATLLVAEYLSQRKASVTTKDSRKAVLEALQKAATKLGNTSTVCESSYVDPRVIAAWEDGRVISDYNSTSDTLDSELSKNERATIALLKSYS